MAVTEVYFESVSINVGDYCTGVTEDGRRITFQTVGRKWDVFPIVAFFQMVSRVSAVIAEIALNRGVQMEYVAEHGGDEE